METSASFEARSAPSLYPTNLLVRIWRGPGVGNCPGLLECAGHGAQRLTGAGNQGGENRLGSDLEVKVLWRP